MAAKYEPPPPQEIGSGPLTTDAKGPTYRVMSVSQNFARDLEYWVPYDYQLLQPGMKLVYQLPFHQCMVEAQLDPTIAKKLSDYLFMDVVSEGGRDWLVFATNTQPSLELSLDPSTISSDIRPWQWPAVFRKQPQFQFQIHSGSLNAVIVNLPECFVEAATVDSTFVSEEWWTASPWPDWLIKVPSPITRNVSWNFIIDKFSAEVLCPEIITPPVNATALRGITQDVHIRGVKFPRTNFKTWGRTMYHVEQKQIRGRWYCVRVTILPPFDRNKFPKPAQIYSS